MIRNLGTKNSKSLINYYKRYCSTTSSGGNKNSNITNNNITDKPPKNNYCHNYFTEEQNYKAYEDNNVIFKNSNPTNNQQQPQSHGGGILGSIKHQMEKLSKITKFGLITLWKDRSYYKNNLLPKASVLNESFVKRIVPTFPIHNKNSFSYLSYHDRKYLISYRMDRLTMIPLSIFLSIPFSTLALPFYLKFLPGLLPRGFSERTQVISRHDKIIKLRKHIVENLIQTYNLENDFLEILSAPSNSKIIQTSVITPTPIQSIEDINPLKLNQLKNKLDFNLEDMKRNQLKQYCRILGHTTILNPRSSLINKILNHGYYILQENEVILKEINDLTFEDFQDLLYSRSLEYTGLTYYEMKNKFIKYTSLLKEISVVEDGNERDINENPNVTLSNRYHYGFYKQYLILNSILLHFKL